MAGKPNSKLTDEGRAYIVMALACWDSPGVVAEAVRKEFAVSIKPQSVEAYDPTKRAGRNLSDKWRALFEATRKEFLEDSSKIGIANKSMRLRSLHRMAEKAEGRGNLALAAQLLEQAAKESGNAYTNRRELTGAGGKDLALGPATLQVVIEGQDAAAPAPQAG
jgi:hypothetical protein